MAQTAQAVETDTNIAFRVAARGGFHGDANPKGENGDGHGD
jgi:hypothetical protein